MAWLNVGTGANRAPGSKYILGLAGGTPAIALPENSNEKAEITGIILHNLDFMVFSLEGILIVMGGILLQASLARKKCCVSGYD